MMLMLSITGPVVSFFARLEFSLLRQQRSSMQQQSASRIPNTESDSKNLFAITSRIQM
jgi:hypothetical protein